jgi:hypothetical protein
MEQIEVVLTRNRDMELQEDTLIFSIPKLPQELREVMVLKSQFETDGQMYYFYVKNKKLISYKFNMNKYMEQFEHITNSMSRLPSEGHERTYKIEIEEQDLVRIQKEIEQNNNDQV